MKKHLLIAGIVFLFVGMTFQPAFAVENRVKTDKFKDISMNEHIGYAIASYLYCYGLIELNFDTGNSSCICPNIYNLNVNGGTWMHSNGRIYAIYNSNEILEIDPETCGLTFIDISGVTEEFVDLSYMPTSDILYAISTQNLYTINLSNGKASLIGSMGNTGEMDSVDCDMDGNIYGLELGSPGYFYSINIITGLATQIGSTGVFINYDAHIAYDKDYDTLYAIVCDSEWGLYELHTIDIPTGFMTLIWIFPSDYEFSVFTIPYSCLNHPPTTPIITGPIHCKVGVEYTYTFNSTHPSGHNITYYVSWGDGSPNESLGPVPPGVEVEATHTWNNKGTYVIRAKAREYDEHTESGWGELTVTIPRDKSTNNMLLLRILEKFPLFQRILDVWRSFVE
jgi:uncharacterized protein YuzE